MSTLLPLEEAQKRLISLAHRLDSEIVPVVDTLERYLAKDLAAKRDQPSADMSAMDGYAIRFEDRAGPWKLIGECKAGSPACRPIGPGETARIFTGALLPGGADTVVMQENVESYGKTIKLTSNPPGFLGRHVRTKGGDFLKDEIVLQSGAPLNSAALGQAVIAGYGELSVAKLPKVAVVSTGDELIRPGDDPLPHQIPASNDIMISAMISRVTNEILNFSRIADDLDIVCRTLENAGDCDIIVTIGGASVGDHDLIGPAFRKLGAEIDFYKIAMQPGKPVMAGKYRNSVILALPGNPASAFVSATLFLIPLIKYMAGASNYLPTQKVASTTVNLESIAKRTKFLRATVDKNGITPFDSQDSAKLSVLASSNALLVRPAFSPELKIGEIVPYIPI